MVVGDRYGTVDRDGRRRGDRTEVQDWEKNVITGVQEVGGRNRETFAVGWGCAEVHGGLRGGGRGQREGQKKGL